MNPDPDAGPGSPDSPRQSGFFKAPRPHESLLRVTIAFALLILPLVMWVPSFFGRSVYLDDSLLFSMPLKVEWAAQLLRGVFPFWSERIGAGYPVFAESQIGVLFPLNALFLLPLPPSAAYGVYAVVCAWVAGFGYLAVSRRFVASRFLQVLSAILYASTGFSFFHASHLNILGILSLLPWLVHFTVRWSESGRVRDFAAAAACGALIVFSGHPPVAAAALLTLALSSILYHDIPWSRRIPSFFSVGLAVAGLSAIQWLPTVALARISTRALTPTAWIEGGALSIADLSIPLFPLTALHQPSVSHAAIELSVTSMGLFIAFLSIFYVKVSPAIRRLWGIVVISFVVATAGGYGLVSTLLPLLKEVRDIQRFALPAFFCLPLLSALAIESSMRRPVKWRLLEAASLLLFLAVLPAVREYPGAFVHLLIFAGVVALWAFPFVARPRWLAVVIFLEALFWGGLFAKIGFVPAARVTSPLELRPPISRVAVALPYHENPVNTLFQKMRSVPIPATAWLYIPQAPQSMGLDSAQSDMQLNAPWFPGIYSYPWNYWVLDPDRPLLDFLRLAGVSHLVSTIGGFRLPEEGSADVFDDLRAHLFRISDPVLNVKFYPTRALEVLPNDEVKIAAKVLAPRSPLMTTLYLVPTATLDLTTDQEKQFAGNRPAEGEFTLNQFVYRGPRITISGTAAQAGFLFISATYAPGWLARVNGAVAPIFRAQYQFMAVPVSAGDLRISMHYEPPGFRVGALISALYLLALLALWLLPGRRVRPMTNARKAAESD
ncbi:MAG: YfhO family protein [bacterium]